MGRVRTTARVPVDPLEPMLSTVTSRQILQIVCGRNALRFSGTEKVPCDWVRIVAE